jgi:hypothetical protein
VNNNKNSGVKGLTLNKGKTYLFSKSVEGQDIALKIPNKRNRIIS